MTMQYSLQNSDFLMLGISFLLGMSGGALASRLIDLGKSSVNPVGGERGSGAQWSGAGCGEARYSFAMLRKALFAGRWVTFP